jgi:hypothetical protein
MLRTALRLRSPMARLAATAVPRCEEATSLRTRVARPVVRFCSGKSEAEDMSTAEEPETSVLLYEGAKNKIVKTIKMVSIANLGFALAACPILQYITALSGTPGKGVAMSGLVRVRLHKPASS